MTSLTEPIPNLPLLRKILDHIDAHPEEWGQGTWVDEAECGTAFCVAGHAVAMTEGVVRDPRDGYLEPASGRGWSEAGCDALGLSYADYCHSPFRHLFSGNNTRENVQYYAEAIAARAGEVL